jgi:two-component system sensor histidine kinase RpfC
MSAAARLRPGLARQAFARLRGRPDSEHEMSLNRLGFGLLLLGCQALIPPPDPWMALVSVALWSAASVGVFLHILARPGISAPRRIAALVLDIGFLSWYLHIGGEAHSAFFAIYLWIVFGNGFRFGLVWLHASMGVALLGFAAVFATTPFWHQQPHLALGLIGGLVVLPLYAGALIRKLSDARAAAETASQAKSLFLANVSHELRTPLNAIIGMSALLRDSRLDAGQRDMVHTVGVAARSLLELIDDILDLSQIEAGRMAVRIEEFDLPDLLAEVRGLVAAQAQARGIRIGLHLAAGTPARLRADRRHLREILVNLAGNAVKFTELGGVSVAVRAERVAEARLSLRFEVSDTGIGVAPDAQQRIFESFTQADPGIVTRFGGTGLGLAICARLVALLGGRIGIESAPGAGSTFWFTFDAEPVPSPEPRPLPEGAAVALLLADDLAARLAPMLAALGLVPRRVDGFAAAVAAAEGGAVVVAEAALLPGAASGGIAGAVAALASPAWPALPLTLVERSPADVLPRDATRWASGSVAADCTGADLSLGLRIAGLARRPASDTGWDAPAGDGAAGPEAGGAAGRRLRVLVADDNAVNRKVAARILERAGHAVVAVADGEAALDALEAASLGEAAGFDLVLMDVNMPVLDGIEATKLFRFASLGQPRRLPVLGLTADAMPATRARCIEAGMDGCLTKPIEPDRLLEAIERLVPPPAGGEVSELASHPRFRPAPAPALDPAAIGRLEALGGPGLRRRGGGGIPARGGCGAAAAGGGRHSPRRGGVPVADPCAVEHRRQCRRAPASGGLHGGAAPGLGRIRGARPGRGRGDRRRTRPRARRAPRPARRGVRRCPARRPGRRAQAAAARGAASRRSCAAARRSILRRSVAPSCSAASAQPSTTWRSSSSVTGSTRRRVS